MLLGNVLLHSGGPVQGAHACCLQSWTARPLMAVSSVGAAELSGAVFVFSRAADNLCVFVVCSAVTGAGLTGTISSNISYCTSMTTL